MNTARGSWVLLPGTPLGPEIWREVGARLANDRPVLAPALPRPANQRGAQGGMAEKLLESLPAGGLHVVGHSYGGQVALEIARRAPDRVDSLTVLCSRAAPFPPFSAAADSLRRGEPVDVDATLARWFVPDELVKINPVVDQVRRFVIQADPVEWADDLEAISTFDARGWLGSLHMSVALIAAELDQVATVTEMASMAQAMPRARLETMAGTSHMSAFIKPADLAERLVR